MKVRIKSEICQGHAMCWLACPEVFQLSDEDGHAFVTDDLVPEIHEESVAQAQRSCPENAIVIY